MSCFIHLKHNTVMKIIGLTRSRASPGPASIWAYLGFLVSFRESRTLTPRLALHFTGKGRDTPLDRGNSRVQGNWYLVFVLMSKWYLSLSNPDPGDQRKMGCNGKIIPMTRAGYGMTGLVWSFYPNLTQHNEKPNPDSLLILFFDSVRSPVNANLHLSVWWKEF